MTRCIAFILLGVCLCCAFTEIPAHSAPLSQSQTATLKKQLGENARLRIHQQTGLVHFLAPDEDRPSPAQTEMDFSAMQAASPEMAARMHLAQYGRYFGVSDPEHDLLLEQQKTGGNGHQYLRYQQTYQGLPILAGELIVQLDGDKRLKSIGGKAAPETTIAVTPVIPAETATRTAQQLMMKYYQLNTEGLQSSTPELCLFNPGLWGRPDADSRLAWKLEVDAESVRVKELVLIDALSGTVLLHFNQMADALSRNIYNGSAGNLPGQLLRSEGGAPVPVSNIHATDANFLYDYFGATYNYYFNRHGRKSINNADMPLVGTVDFCPYGDGCQFNNAGWNGKQMIFGHGYVTDDVVAHEYTHGVTSYESKLFYYGESGAINEAFSDMWGEFVDLTYGGDANVQRWAIGEDLPVGAIRNMSNPTAFELPDRIGSVYYVCADDGDSGGVHTNNGVNSKAVTLMVDGGTFNGQIVTGIGIGKVAKIYYEAQSNLLISGSDYGDLYTAVQQACTSLVGTLVDSSELTTFDCAEVKKALDAVNMGTPPCAAPADVPLCNAGFSPNNLFYDGFETATTNWVTEGSGFWQKGSWTIFNQFAASGTKSLFGAGTGDNFSPDYPYDPIPEPSLLTRRMSVAKLLPDNAFLSFDHVFFFENFGGTNYDGGVLRYSTDNGATKIDAGPLFVANGYNGTIASGSGNPIETSSAFVGDRFRYGTSKLDLATLAGQSVKFYFMLGSDEIYSSNWAIDNVRIYTCKDNPPNNLSLQIDDGAIYTTGQNVDLTLAAEDAGSGVAGMRFSNDGVNWPLTWEAFAEGRNNWLLSNGNGIKTVYAQFRDASGSISASVKATIIYDSTPPVFTVAAVTPKPAGTPSVTISGTREANAVMKISGGATIGTLNTPTPLTWHCTLTDLTPGNSTFAVTATDLAGNTALAKNVVIKIAPTIDLDPVTSPTNKSSQTIGGTVQAGCSVAVYKGTVNLGNATVVGTDWSYSLTGLIANLSNLYTVTAVDVYGNKTSKPVTILYDTLPPAFTVVAVPVQPAGTTSVKIGGTREAKATLAVTTDCGTAIDPVVYPTATTWSCVLRDPLPVSSIFTVTASDLAGNTSAAKNIEVKVAPILNINPFASPTTAASLTLEGSAPPGVSVALYKGTVKLGEKTDGGAWSFPITLVANSKNSFTVTATDSKGNKTSKPVVIVQDSLAPAFTVAAVSNPKPAGTTALLLSGTREANAAIAIASAGSTMIGDPIYPTTTAWRCQLTALPPASSSVFVVTATDLAGNTSAAKNVTVTVAP